MLQKEKIDNREPTRTRLVTMGTRIRQAGHVSHVGMYKPSEIGRHTGTYGTNIRIGGVQVPEPVSVAPGPLSAPEDAIQPNMQISSMSPPGGISTIGAPGQISTIAPPTGDMTAAPQVAAAAPTESPDAEPGAEGASVGQILMVVLVIVGVIIVAIVIVVVARGLSSRVDSVVNFVSDGVVEIAGIANGAINSVESLLADAYQFVQNTAEDIGAAIAAGLSTAISAITTVEQTIIDALTTFINTLGTLLSDLESALVSFFSTAIQPVLDLIIQIGSDIVTAINSVRLFLLFLKLVLFYLCIVCKRKLITMVVFVWWL